MQSRLLIGIGMCWIMLCEQLLPTAASVRSNSSPIGEPGIVEVSNETPEYNSSLGSSDNESTPTTDEPSNNSSSLLKVCAKETFYAGRESILNYFLRMRSCDILEGTNSRMEKICRTVKFTRNEYFNVTYLAACDGDRFREICEVNHDIADPWKYHDRAKQKPYIAISHSQGDAKLITRACLSVTEFLRATMKTPGFNMNDSSDINTTDSFYDSTFSDAVKSTGKIPEVDYSEWYIPTFPFCRNFAYGSTRANHSSDETSVYDCMPTECRGMVIFSIIFDAVLAVLIILSNSLVLGVAARTKIMRNIPGYFKISLALADLTVGIFVLPCCIFMTYALFLDAMPYRAPGHKISVADYISEPVANFIGFFVVLSFAVSVYTMAIASVDRYLAITKPFQYRQGHYLTKRRSTLAFALIWILAFFIAIFPAFSHERFGVSAYNIVLAVGVNSSLVYAVTLFIPLLAVWSLNIAMLKQVCSDKEKRSSIRASTVIANSPQRTPNQPLTTENTSADPLHAKKSDDVKESTAELGKTNNGFVLVNGDVTKTRNVPASNVGYQKNGKAGHTSANDGVIERMKMRKRSRLNSVFQRKTIPRRMSIPNSITVERRLARTLAIMIGAFTLALFPCIATLIAYAILASDSSPQTSNQLASVLYIASRILLSNSFWNCIIYSIRNRHFRRAMWAIFLCRKEKIDRKLRESISMSQWKRRSAVQSTSGSNSSDKQSLSKSNSTNSSNISYKQDHRRSTMMWSFASHSPTESRKASCDGSDDKSKDNVARTMSCPREYAKPGILKKTVERSESAPQTNQKPLPTQDGIDRMNIV